MSGIEQIYGTHCTYASSAIERRDGDMADRVVGYSARASSLPQDVLRREFRTFERYLYYYLPTDSPPERKLDLPPQTAPRRLLFNPSASGWQILTQVCYRQWDVVHQRPGSYFSHVLTAKR